MPRHGRASDATLRELSLHLLAIVSFISLAIWCTLPLILKLDSVIPGTGAGDNVSFLWNVWWFRHHPSRFWTDALFFPVGTSLVLHTHAWLPSIVAASMATLTSPVMGLNLVIIAGLAANGVVTYWLAWRVSRMVLPSLAAGLVVAAAAVVQVRLLGHFNLIHVWVLPLFAGTLIAHLNGGSWKSAVALGLAAAAVTYTDYYYAVYCILALALVAAYTAFEWRVSRAAAAERFRRRRVSAALTITLLVALASTVAIAWSGGVTVEPWSGLRLSARSIRNPSTVVWMIAAFRIACSLEFSVRRRHGRSLRSWLQPAVAPLLVYAVLVSPLIGGAVDLLRQGDYVTQNVQWRNSPPGIDLATVITGHPRHLVIGESVERVYSRLGIDSVEQTAYVGLTALALIMASLRRILVAAGARVWCLIALAFALLAMGPFIRAFGADTGLVLPDALLRYVPIVSNARMPGRAILVVQVALAVLVALALRSVSRRIQIVVVTLLLVELIPAPIPLWSVPEPDSVDAELVTSQLEGAVIELPAGLRDGLGQQGLLDDRAFVHQMYHGRPLVGGFVARLSPRIRQAYADSALLSSFIRVSANPTNPLLADGTAEEARSHGIAFLIINRDAIAEADWNQRPAIERAGFRFIRAAGSRELYASDAAGTQ